MRREGGRQREDRGEGLVGCERRRGRGRTEKEGCSRGAEGRGVAWVDTESRTNGADSQRLMDDPDLWKAERKGDRLSSCSLNK
jgi:hypothetical protein